MGPQPQAPSLTETSEKLDARGKVVQSKVDECNVQLAEIKKQMATAKGTRLNTLKQKALMILKRRKMYDNQVNQVMNQQFNIDQVAFTTESINDTINTVAALKAGNEVMKNTVKELDMDNIEDLYDDMAEMMADMEEVQEVMGRTYNCEFDEEGLMDELNELDEEIAMDQLGQGSGMPSYIPNQPSANPASQVQ